jgi:hypothetical protein
MSRSLRVDPKYIQKVNLALKRNGYPSQRKFAEDIVPSLSTVKNFLKGKPVDYENFREICERLGLDWQAVTYIDVDVEPNEEVAKLPRESTEVIDASASALSAERRVDYSRLRDLLAAGKWRDADRETGTVMLKAASKVRQGWLRSDDIKKFPCTDLQIIDSLWGKYSHGRFGFSIQKRILLDIGGTNDADLQTFHAFADSVGWRVEGVWVARVKHTIDAPEGHLPDLDFGISPHYVEGFRAARGLGHDGAWNARRTILSALVSKLADCNIR